jgi:hypothetical protein
MSGIDWARCEHNATAGPAPFALSAIFAAAPGWRGAMIVNNVENFARSRWCCADDGRSFAAERQ